MTSIRTILCTAALLVTVQPIGHAVAGRWQSPDITGERALINDVNAAPLDRSTIASRRGYDLNAPFRPADVDAGGRVTIYGEEVDLFELRMGADSAAYAGYLRQGSDVLPLPIGSSLNPETGVFTWQPGVAFLHTYDLVFVRWSSGRAVARREVRFVLSPRASGLTGPQVVIETPSAQAAIGQPFVLAGSAVDLNAGVGTGVATLHVWAYPATGAPPRFVGVAAYGGDRPDVGAVLGDRYRDSGYGVVVQGLEPGTYDLAVFAWSTATGDFVPAKVVRVTVR